MNEANLTTKELLQIVPEMDGDQLGYWCEKGIINHAEGGGNQGVKRMWDMRTAFALRHAHNIGKTDANGAGMLHPGVRTDEFRKLVAFFLTNVELKELVKAVKEERDFLLFTGEREPLFRFIAPPKGVELPDHLNVAVTLKEVQDAMKVLVNERK